MKAHRALSYSDKRDTNASKWHRPVGGMGNLISQNVQSTHEVYAENYSDAKIAEIKVRFGCFCR